MDLSNVSNVKNVVKDLNTFKLLQHIWILMVYFLMINSIVKNSLSFIEDEIHIKVDIPDFIIKYDEAILGYMRQYDVFVLLVGGAIMLTSIAVCTVKFLPVLGNYDIISY